MITATAEIEGRRQVFDEGDFPLSVGGPMSHISLPGTDDDSHIAFIGRDHDDLFIQPAEQSSGVAAVTCNGVALTVSRWLENGDLVAIGESRIRISAAPGGYLFVVEGLAETPLANGEANSDPEFQPAPELPPVVPISFQPRWQTPASARTRRVRPQSLMVAALFLALSACAWYVLTARSVVVEATPPADSLAVSGGVAPGFGGRYLLRPGTYRLRAARAGFIPLDTEFEIDAETPPVLSFALEPLGGTVSITARPVAEASVLIDGREVGRTPIKDLPLSAGDHSLEVRAPLHLDYRTTVVVEPGNPPMALEANLEPNWAPVSFASAPSGAEIRVDQSVVGTTPATFKLEAGVRIINIRKPGYKPVERSLQLVAGTAVDLGVVKLAPNDGTLAVTSRPGGATVTIGSEYRGTTPLELTVAPGAPLQLEVSLAGHSTFSTEVSVASGKSVQVRATLEKLTGQVIITSTPPGAEIVVNGSPRGRTEKTLELEASPHEIEVRLEGYVPYRTTLTPEPGLAQAVRAALKPAGPAGLPKTITTPQEAELVLIGPGRFRMGASRREPGRRANEVLRDVEITGAYYLGIREVSNREFREFKSGHLSGAYGGHNLEIDHHPVVNVSWQDAARYCNWLSQKAGLPPVYVERAGTLSPRSPMPHGYRLPTEAEWAWAARYASSSSPTKYAWGQALPIPPGQGNYGDAAAQNVLGTALPNYTDGYPATAPVGSFSANSLGIFNLGGNVAEWVHDLYAFAPGSPGDVESDPTGPGSGTLHVVRGASWMDTAVTELRLTYRDSGDQPRPDLGFRIARSAQ